MRRMPFAEPYSFADVGHVHVWRHATLPGVPEAIAVRAGRHDVGSGVRSAIATSYQVLSGAAKFL